MIDGRVENWSDFIDLVDYFDIATPDRVEYLFRGQADANWDLAPTLLRQLRETGVSEEKAIKVEAHALGEFKSQATLHISPNMLTTTTDLHGWWSLMQDYGAPTRLLDWCESIYVAAYFAVTGEPKADGAVWVVHMNTIMSRLAEKCKCKAELPRRDEWLTQFCTPGAPQMLLFGVRRAKTERMVAQQTIHSVCRNIYGNHGEIIRNCVDELKSDRALFEKITIPADLKMDFLKKLRRMNITANSLFPGLDGLGRSIREFVQSIAV